MQGRGSEDAVVVPFSLLQQKILIGAEAGGGLARLEPAPFLNTVHPNLKDSDVRMQTKTGVREPTIAKIVFV